MTDTSDARRDDPSAFTALHCTKMCIIREPAHKTAVFMYMKKRKYISRRHKNVANSSNGRISANLLQNTK